MFVSVAEQAHTQRRAALRPQFYSTSEAIRSARENHSAYLFQAGGHGPLPARLLIQQSIANAGQTVPFYFDPTTDGPDINGQSIKSNYPDYHYRFRTPNILLIHGAYE